MGDDLTAEGLYSQEEQLRGIHPKLDDTLLMIGHLRLQCNKEREKVEHLDRQLRKCIAARLTDQKGAG